MSRKKHTRKAKVNTNTNTNTTPRQIGVRNANVTRLQGAVKTILNINSANARELIAVRERARALVVNNPYASRYAQHAKGSLVGAAGAQLISTPHFDDGSIDKQAAKSIKKAWKKYMKKHLFVDPQMTMPRFQELLVDYYKRDGEFFIERSFTPEGVRFNFIDPMVIDPSVTSPKGTADRRVINGVEVDKNYVPYGYHLRLNTSNQDRFRTEADTRRVAADDVFHGFRKNYVYQTRGISAFAPVAQLLERLDQYTDAELINKQVASSRMGFYIQKDGDEAELAGQLTADGVYEQVEAGSITALPYGMEFQSFNPTDTSTTYPQYTAKLLEAIASGLNIAPINICGDFSSVNYSSARVGLAMENEAWASDRLIIDQALSWMFTEWITTELTLVRKNLYLPSAKLNKWTEHRWIARKREAVDQQKEAAGVAARLATLQTTLSDVILESGRDPDDVFAQTAADINTCNEIGIDYNAIIFGLAQANISVDSPSNKEDK